MCASLSHYVSTNVSSKLQLEWMICSIHHICTASPRCEWAGASSDLQLDWKICCTLSTYASLPHCVSTSESLDFQLCWMLCCIQHICAVSLHCEWAGELSDFWDMQKTCCTWCKDVCWPCFRSKSFSSDCWQQLMKFIRPTEPCHVHFYFSTLNLPCWNILSPSTL